jgi:hypothetical protein
LLPFASVAPGLADAGLMILLGFIGVVSHFCLIRAFAAAPAISPAPNNVRGPGISAKINRQCSPKQRSVAEGRDYVGRRRFGRFPSWAKNMSSWRICRILNVMCEGEPVEELSRAKRLLVDRDEPSTRFQSAIRPGMVKQWTKCRMDKKAPRTRIRKFGAR